MGLAKLFMLALAAVCVTPAIVTKVTLGTLGDGASLDSLRLEVMSVYGLGVSSFYLSSSYGTLEQVFLKRTWVWLVFWLVLIVGALSPFISARVFPAFLGSVEVGLPVPDQNPSGPPVPSGHRELIFTQLVCKCTTAFECYPVPLERMATMPLWAPVSGFGNDAVTVLCAIPCAIVGMIPVVLCLWGAALALWNIKLSLSPGMAHKTSACITEHDAENITSTSGGSEDMKVGMLDA